MITMIQLVSRFTVFLFSEASSRDFISVSSVDN